MSVPSSRPPIARFQAISRLLAGRWRKADELAGELEVSSKTVCRDLEYMRDQLGVEIESGQHGHRIVNTAGLCACCQQPLDGVPRAGMCPCCQRPLEAARRSPRTERISAGPPAR